MPIAIIGCGWVGAHHARAYAGCQANVSWAVDLDQERAKAVQAVFPQCQTTAVYEDVLNDPAVEAVDICLPHNLHAPVAIAAV